MILPPEFYAHDAVTVAKDLLGCLLVHQEEAGMAAGWIVEDEAYLRGDPAAHSFRGETKRNRVLFGPPGRAYIYRIYGLYTCIDVVTGPEGAGGAVLIRALEPAVGIDLMRERRGTDDPLALASGPGTDGGARHHDGPEQGSPSATVPSRSGRRRTPGRRPEGWPGEVVQTRIGITKAADRPLRFYLKGSRYVSRR